MKRIKEPGEGKAPPAPDASKLSRNLYGTKMTCMICKQKGHNKRGCSTIKNQSQQDEGSSKGNKAPKKQQAKRTTAPKGLRNVLKQIITSRRAWKKRKEAGETKSTRTAQASSSQREHRATEIASCTSSQNVQQPSSQFIEHSQTSSKWASF
ncbi:putative transcription factor interactor and regulator CCHC(Zn) family [Rosa chinensis]|uniref:Putative transcription factor interactor and regulator CCHC(Zn) family n=2 Tax=Rosa chinensis TaxID=74649 RepID=A0A2P6RIR0_ROSCH|nr:putative transcription factor interactor and regulator CCHC(Zn) family [Rosa chinensis]